MAFDGSTQSLADRVWDKIKPSNLARIGGEYVDIDGDLASALEIILDRADHDYMQPRRGQPTLLGQVGRQVFLFYRADDEEDQVTSFGGVKDFSQLIVSLTEFAECTEAEMEYVLDQAMFLQNRQGATNRNHPELDFDYDNYVSLTERQEYQGAMFI